VTWPARSIGKRTVWPIGLGSMELTFRHDRVGQLLDPIPEDQAIATLHAALDAGIRLIDTAINYSVDTDKMGLNEALVGKALASWSGDRDSVLVVCKGGNKRSPTELWVHDGSRANLRWSCETSLRALRIESAGLYILHAPDPKIPIAESVGALAELRDEGKIQMIGVSNMGRRQLAEARAVTEIAAVENQLSPFARGALSYAKACADEGIAFLAWSPMGGPASALPLGERMPSIGRIATTRGITAQQVALAWDLAQSPNVIPIPSSSVPEFAASNAAAADVVLTADELSAIDGDTPLP
jgi:aryl-alcohol dehydrogenase-like predicted oxidoreductase